MNKDEVLPIYIYPLSQGKRLEWINPIKISQQNETEQKQCETELYRREEGCYKVCASREI